MSKVMQALENSERLHQALEPTQAHTPHALHEPKVSVNKLACALAVLLPPLLVAGGVGYQAYQDYQSQWLVDNVAHTVVVETPFAFTSERAPEFATLSSTYRPQDPVTDLYQTDSESLPVENAVSTKSQPNDDLLKGLDLSALSPELAQRFESALSSQPNQTKERSSDVSNLAQDAQQWYGKLPALNFQTHVYSSKESKRWVKINGTEYGQGDWINDDLQLVAIEQQSCLVRFKGEEIEIPALYDWQG